MNGFNICLPDYCFCSFKVERTCHKVSVIHVTKRMLCPIQVVGSDIVDPAVTNVQLNNVFYMNNGRTLPST